MRKAILERKNRKNDDITIGVVLVRLKILSPFARGVSHATMVPCTRPYPVKSEVSDGNHAFVTHVFCFGGVLSL